MRVAPGLPAGVDDPVSQQEFREAVPGPHQIGAAVLTGPHQVACCFGELVGDGDCGERIQPQQRRQVFGVDRISLHPRTGRPLELGRGRDNGSDVDRRRRAGQRLDPGRHLHGVGAESGFEDFSGLDVHRMRHHGAGMHIQANTRTLGKQPGPPTYVGKARQAAPVRQPTNRCAERPRPARASPQIGVTHTV